MASASICFALVLLSALLRYMQHNETSTQQLIIANAFFSQICRSIYVLNFTEGFRERRICALCSILLRPRFWRLSHTLTRYVARKERCAFVTLMLQCVIGIDE
jgi:hypothetical protein